ncbi:hypothetical protein GH733_004250 [Mirounga leonina]|nr:hypothetical protein GH733_004250 [Mirounga leonina]
MASQEQQGAGGTGAHGCGKPRVLTAGSVGGRLSGGVETLRAAPSEGQAESWHRALSSATAHSLSLELPARPVGFPAAHAAESAPSTASPLRFHGCPPTSSLRETPVSADGQPQPLGFLQAAGPAPAPAHGSHCLSCPSQAQGLGPEANPEVAANLRATNKDNL